MLALNILLSAAALAAAISAIGGQTWNRKAAGWKRITSQGWLAIFCAALTFAVGIIKERITIAKEVQVEIDSTVAARLAKENGLRAEAEAKYLRSTIDGQVREIAALNGRVESLLKEAGEAGKRKDVELGERAEEKRRTDRAKALVAWIIEGWSTQIPGVKTHPYDHLISTLKHREDRNSPITKDDISIVEEFGRSKINAIAQDH